VSGSPHSTVRFEEKRAFLLAGRLEATPLPALLAPRLRVDLFPELQPGIRQVVDTWRGDREAETITQRPVAASPLSRPADPERNTVYVTSEAFGITVPVKADLDAPAGVLLDRIVDRARLPKVWQYEGRIGVRFSYTLMNGEQELDRGRPFSAQNVVDKSVLWLKTRMSPFSDAAPMEGSLTAMTFRNVPIEPALPDSVSAARQEYLSAMLEWRRFKALARKIMKAPPMPRKLRKARPRK
jgi:hypothetical protein